MKLTCLSPQTVAWLSSIIHRQRVFTPFRMISISNAPFIGTCLLVTSSPLVTTRYWSKDKRWSLSCGSCHRKHPWQLNRHHSASVQLWKKSCTSWFSSFGSLSHYLRSLYIPKKCMISSINRTCIDLYDVSASGHGWFKQGLEEKLAILWRRYCNHVILLHVLFDEQWLFSQVSIWKSTALSPLSLSYSVRNLTIPFESLESFHFSTPSIQRAPHTCFEWVRPRRHSPKSAINHVMGNRIAWFCIAGGRLQVQVQLIREKKTCISDIFLQDLSKVLCTSCQWLCNSQLTFRVWQKIENLSRDPPQRTKLSKWSFWSLKNSLSYHVACGALCLNSGNWELAKKRREWCNIQQIFILLRSKSSVPFKWRPIFWLFVCQPTQKTQVSSDAPGRFQYGKTSVNFW